MNRKLTAFAASLLAGSLLATPALAQQSGADDEASSEQDSNVIIVTAQRQAQSLQDVPIAVSAFSAAAIEAQQIENASDLQLTLPNVSFTKSNFTSSSFTIRGIGDLCVGVSCDSATAIHVNSAPLFGTRLFETEYFDLERIEVLRGPQGTLFGRNATSGVVNVVTAKPDLSGLAASASFDYGKFDAIKATGMINLPLGDTLGVRAAGFYLNRDGYTENLFDGNRIDGRDMYAFRGSLRWEPGPDTTIDLMGYYFRENDDRLRIQKQMCQRDPTGVLGCLNGRLANDVVNGNSTFVGTLGSEEFLQINGLPPGFGLNSLYGPDPFANALNPSDPRQVETAFTPTYFSDELQLQAHIDHDFGALSVSLTGTYQEARVDSRQDNNLAIADRSLYTNALNQLAFFAANDLIFPGSSAYFAPIAQALIPGGPSGQLCTSDARLDNRGAFEGFSVCGDDPVSFDRSNIDNESFSTELIVSSDFDGPINFLLGGIYSQSKVNENSYFVNSFAIDYITGLLGSFTSLANALPPSYLATSFFRNNTTFFKLKSYGIFGEAYFDISDRLKFTAGLRYNDDSKDITARSTLASFLNPFSNDGDPFDSPFVGSFDADPGLPGAQSFQSRQVSFSEVTGRAVLDFQATPDNLFYASYTRGYKSGGINPPLQPIFEVPESFGAESIDAFEIGTKNSFADGKLQLNASAFYYKYSDLQLSRIIARTAVNDTIDANIWGVEVEAVVRPDPAWLINLGFSYLNTKVAGDQFFSNPRDPGGGDPNAVIIKDITNGSNCAVVGAGANAFVNTINPSLGLQGTAPFPADGNIASTGAFSICSVLQAQAAAIGGLFGGIDVLSPGVEVNIRGNKLPQAPEMKASVGVQYTRDFDNGMSLVPRFDLTLTGDQYGNIFNGNVNKVPAFVQANAQIQLNGNEGQWYTRVYIQNIFDSNSITGLHLGDASQGLFTNVFTLDPRRYGIAVGVNF